MYYFIFIFQNYIAQLFPSQNLIFLFSILKFSPKIPQNECPVHNEVPSIYNGLVFAFHSIQLNSFHFIPKWANYIFWGIISIQSISFPKWANYISCVSSQIVKGVPQNGNVQEFRRSVKATELMLGNSQQFVNHASCGKAGKRAARLAAEEELQMGHLYTMLHMNNLNSALTTSDVAPLLLLHKNNGNNRQSSKRHCRILPVLTYMYPLTVVEC